MSRSAPGHRLTRWLFLRLLGGIFLIAFLSLWVQIEGLVGSDGILPVAEWLDAVHEGRGAEAYRLLPTLLWIDASDPALHALCAVGVVLAVLLIADLAPLVCLVALWACYLSLVVGGQKFLSFQWDMLLLEVALAAIFFAPAHLGSRSLSRQGEPSRAGLWLLRGILFKLMFLSGVVKLLANDDAWWQLTALDYHYFTQPLPTWTSWYAHQLPSWLQKPSVFFMFVIEIGVPFLIFCGRRARMVAFAALVGLQLLIALTGNYGFFNWLTIVLCVPLLDDGVFRRFTAASGPQWTRPRRWSWRSARAAVVALLLFVSLLNIVDGMVATERRHRLGGWTSRALDLGDRLLLSWGTPWLLTPTAPFRSINDYGLFRVMTTRRPEIVVEGSHDGTTWLEYAFRWKPGDPALRPRFVAPHQPRLDWQMWFAALNPRGSIDWLNGLLLRLLEGSPDVSGLLAEGPFEDRPPRYVRLVLYDYEFSAETWWERKPGSPLTRPLSLDDYGR